MKFGSTVWPFRWDLPYEGAIGRIARLGLKGVELIAWDRKVLDEYYTPRRIKDLRELISSLGLELTEFVSTPQGMASLRKKDQDDALSHFKKLVEVGSELGTKIVNSVSPWPFDTPMPRLMQRPLMQTFLLDIPYDQDMEAIWVSYVSLMKKFADVLEGAGLRYAIEPHPFRIVSNIDAMLRLMDQVGSKAIGMNWDPSHLFPSGETPAVGILRLKDRVFHVHISDNDAVTNAHWRPGKGKIDWESVLRAMKAVGYNFVLSLELENAPGVSARDGPDEAGPIFDREVLESVEFIGRIAKDVGIKIER
jgi:sugar phosphate isomerase/epimerase